MAEYWSDRAAMEGMTKHGARLPSSSPNPVYNNGFTELSQQMLIYVGRYEAPMLQQFMLTSHSLLDLALSRALAC